MKQEDFQKLKKVFNSKSIPGNGYFDYIKKLTQKFNNSTLITEDTGNLIHCLYVPEAINKLNSEERFQIILDLIKTGFDITEPDSDGITVLQMAFLAHDFKVINLCLKFQMNFNCYYKNIPSYFLLAVKLTDHKIVSKFLVNILNEELIDYMDIKRFIAYSLEHNNFELSELLIDTLTISFNQEEKDAIFYKINKKLAPHSLIKKVF